MYNYKSAFDQEAQLVAGQEAASKDELIRDPEARLAHFVTKMKSELQNEDPEVVFLVQSQIERGYYNEQYKQIDKTLDFLYEKSEALIESPDANTSAVLERRQYIKDNINLLLSLQELVKKGLDRAEENRITGSLMSQDKHTRAHAIVTDIRKEIDAFFAEPPIDLN